MRLAERILAGALLLVALAGYGLFPAPAHAQGDVVDELLGGEPPADDAPPERTIDTRSDALTDADIRRRLQGIYAELEPQRALSVEVANGIVTLRGTAASSAAAERAIQIAESVEGVVEVVDEAEVDTNVRRRLAQTVQRLRTSTLGAIAALPVLLVALAILAAFWFLGRWIGGRKRVYQALAPNGFIAELLGGIVRVLVTLGGVLLALTLLDATSLIGTVLGAAGIVGLAVGFAVRDTVENYIASILLSVRTPFLAQDLVLIDDHFGTVARLTSRATVLISPDGNHIRLPNSLVFKAVIVNYTRNPERRLAFRVGVDTDFDPLVAQTLALETLAAMPDTLSDPGPTARVMELGDSNVTLELAAWIDQRASDYLAVQSEAVRGVKQAFDAAGIVMPEPIYRLRLDARGAGGPLLSRLAGIVDTVDADKAGGRADGSGPGSGDDPSAPARERDVGADGPARDTPGAAPDDERVDRAAAARVLDTSVDTTLARTVEREREDGAEEDLLHAGVRRE